MSALVEAARGYRGTPFVHQGRVRGIGVDCVGLIAGAARDAGLPVSPVPANYGRMPDGQLERELEARCERVHYLEEMEVGDILLFRVYSLRPRHVALVTCLDPLTMIHAYEGAETVAEHTLDMWWFTRIHSIWRLPA